MFTASATLPFTYPLWYDVSYWMLDSRNSFNLDAQLSRCCAESEYCIHQVILPIGVSLVAYLVLFVMGPGWLGVFGHISRSWPLIGPGAAGVCLYLSVYVEPSSYWSIRCLDWDGPAVSNSCPRNAETYENCQSRGADSCCWLFILSAGLPIYHMVRLSPCCW